MKKINTNKLVSLLAVLCIITSVFVGGTLAKYTSKIEGQATARVASWDIAFANAEGGEITDFQTEFDLFATSYNNVESAGEDNVIAPGTEGEFSIKITNNSEVGAKFVANITESNLAGIPIEYTTDKNDEDSWAPASGGALSVDGATLAKGVATDVTIYWRWAFDGDDSADTTLGTKGTDTVTVTAAFSATQID